jgi:GT2 family glycosyltransferase
VTTRRVSVVIPAYEGGQDLLACLASIAASGLRPAAVHVVDNASTDGSIEAAQHRFPHIDVIRNATNRGFGAACNQGIERALAHGDDFVLLLNQDALLEPETLGSMIGLAAAQPRAGVIGAKTLSPRRAPDGAPILLYDGAWRTSLPLWQRIPGIGRSSREAGSAPRRVDYVWGHGMLLRSEALRAVGAFDPGFFMYFEDLDLCRRMQAAGWEVWCDSGAVMWHAVADGARATGSETWRWEMKMTSARYFYRKHHGRLRADALWLLTALREAASLLRNGHRAAARHLLQAWWKVAAGRA